MPRISLPHIHGCFFQCQYYLFVFLYGQRQVFSDIYPLCFPFFGNLNLGTFYYQGLYLHLDIWPCIFLMHRAAEPYTVKTCEIWNWARGGICTNKIVCLALIFGLRTMWCRPTCVHTAQAWSLLEEHGCVSVCSWFWSLLDPMSHTCVPKTQLRNVGLFSLKFLPALCHTPGVTAHQGCDFIT